MNKEKKDILVFGFGLGAISGVLSVIGWIKHGLQWPSLLFLICSIIFIGTTTLDWEALKPSYKGWMHVAHVIGSCMTYLILSLVFILIFVPAGIMCRILGKDHLERTIDRQAISYWKKRPLKPFSTESYRQQF